MNDLQRGVISVLRSALTGKKVSLPEDFDLSLGIKIACRHKTECLFYYGALNCGISGADPLMQELFMLVCKNIALSEQQSYSFNKIFLLFDEQKIEYMPLKGTLLKQLYPKPEMRSMSDADILIKKEQYDKIKPIMSGLGYTEVTESDHELIWNKQNIHIELHKKLIPSYNKDYYAYYGDGWRLAAVKDGTRYSMNDEDQFIYLFTHFAKHYRDGGIGIKHLTDLYVYLKAKPDMNRQYIDDELRKLQLLKFWKNIADTIGVWFDNSKEDKISDLITDTIFGSGSYGTYRSHAVADAFKKSKSFKTEKTARRKQIISLIFLPYGEMSQKYPVLKKCPLLLPVMWPVRWAEAVFFKKGSIRMQSDKLKITSVDNVGEYGERLKQVGLDFNFKE